MNREVIVRTGKFLESAGEVGSVVVGVYGGSPVYVRDVATVVDGAEEVDNYNFLTWVLQLPKVCLRASILLLP